MVANKTEFSMFDYRSGNKFLVAEKCEQCEIYKRMHDVNRESCFNQNNVHKLGKTWVCHYKPKSKRQSIEWKHTDSPVKKNFWVQQSIKCFANSLLGHEKTYHYWYSNNILKIFENKIIISVVNSMYGC